MPDCTVEEFYHYYPFGELMAESSYGSFKAQRYTGKESDTWLGPSVIDNSARFKLGAAGTFTSVDRLADQTPASPPTSSAAPTPSTIPTRQGMTMKKR